MILLCAIAGSKSIQTGMPAADRVGMKVRRLTEIRIIRKPIWKDVKL